MRSEMVGDGPACVLDIAAQLGEGPIWVAEEGAVWFVDIPQSRIHRFTPENCAHQSWQAPNRVAFIVPDAQGGFVCGLPDGLHHFDPASGVFTSVLPVEKAKPGNRLNDAAVSSAGALWFGTMHDGETLPAGALYRLTREDGSAGGLHLSLHDEGYTVSNGPALSADGQTLYACDSPRQMIFAFDVTPQGSLRNKRIFATLDEGYPDGITVDEAGGLWCCVYGGGRAMRFAPDGQVTDIVRLPASFVTKLTLGGKDRRMAYVTTGRRNLSDAALAHQPQAGGLFAFRVSVPGLPQYAFGQAPG